MTLGHIDLSKIGSNHITAEDTDFDCLCRAVRLPNQYSFFLMLAISLFQKISNLC